MEKKCHPLEKHDRASLFRQNINEVINDMPMQILSSTYIPNEHRIRDTAQIAGYPVLTFANILKANLFPLSEILQDIMKIGKQGMGCPVELEFSVNLLQNISQTPEFAFLQLRPMASRYKTANVIITEEEKKKSFCFSSNTVGNTKKQDIHDIVYVRIDNFDPSRTREIAREVGRINSILAKKNLGICYLDLGDGVLLTVGLAFQ